MVFIDIHCVTLIGYKSIHLGSPYGKIYIGDVKCMPDIYAFNLVCTCAGATGWDNVLLLATVTQIMCK